MYVCACGGAGIPISCGKMLIASGRNISEDIPLSKLLAIAIMTVLCFCLQDQPVPNLWVALPDNWIKTYLNFIFHGCTQWPNSNEIAVIQQFLGLRRSN